ncbi:MAG: trypsin-like serine protease [Pirellulales bacterium]|nr:trypsin-like serine protease [Pirellulales bacterium]
MSLFRLPKLRRIASHVGHFRDRFAGRSSTRGATERSYRRLALDPLEQRQLLSLSPMGPVDHLVNESFVGDVGSDYEVYDLDTLSGQSVAVDDDGDFVVTWTRYDYVLDPTTGNYIIDPISGGYMTDANIYARYYTDEVQRLDLPVELANDAVSGAYGNFSLIVGGNEVQKLTISSAPEPYWPEELYDPITGTFTMGFDVNGNGSIGAGERFTMIYDEWYMQANEDMMQAGLRGLGGALTDVVVDCVAPNEFYVYFGDQSHGLNQPEIEINPAFTNWTSGFYPAAMMSTVREPVTITNIPVHPTDPYATARVIEQMFLYNMMDHYQAPTFFATEEEVFRDTDGNNIDDDHPEERTFEPMDYTEPIKVRYTDYRVSVMPVLVLNSVTGKYEPSLTSFEVTYIDESGKTNIPEMVLVAAVDDAGVSHLDPTADYVSTIKEPSPEFRVNDPEPDDPFTPWPDKTHQYEAAVAMDADGDFVITWTSEVAGVVSDTSLSDVYARRFSPSSYVDDPQFVLTDGTKVHCVTPQGNAFLVNTYETGAQNQPAVGMDADGNFVISWVSTSQELSYFNHVSAQRYNRDGDRVGSEFIVVDNTDDTDTDIHFDPYVSLSDDGYVLFTWTQTRDPDYTRIDEYTGRFGYGYASWVNARLFNPDMTATAVWTVSDFNTTASGGGGASTSAFDSAGGFLISYDVAKDSDNIGVFSEGIYVIGYQLVEDADGNITGVGVNRNEFRANSSSFLTGTRTLWSGDQWNGNIMVDADGDITATYEGFGADSSEEVTMVTYPYYTGLINADKNADLLAFFDPTYEFLEGFSPEYTGSDWADNVDQAIEYYLIRAQNLGATSEQIGRLYAVLNTYAGMIRGESNGVFFSNYDAEPGASANELTGDSVLNAQRDGSDAVYIVEIDSRATGGSFKVTVWNENTGTQVTATIAPVYRNNVLQPNPTAAAIEAGIQAALGGNWSSWPVGGGYEGVVECRRIDNTAEWSSRDFTSWAWYQSDTFYYVYEVSFEGDLHDMWVTMARGESAMVIGDVPAAPPVITPYNFGEMGEQQTYLSSDMQPDGDFIAAWSQWEEDTNGLITSTNVYFREFNESTDPAGPDITDFLLDDGTRLTDGGQVIDTMNYIIVTFDERLDTTMGGTHSVTNLANWSLMKDGVELAGGISDVVFGLNVSTTLGLNTIGSNKWEAVVFFDGNGSSAGVTDLAGGNYQIVASNAIRDVAGNPLGRTGYLPQGESVSRSFYLTPPTGTETLVNTAPQASGTQILLDTVGDPDLVPNSPRSIAGDADGDYVVVWTDETGAQPGVWAKLYRTTWTETAGERISTTTSLPAILVTPFALAGGHSEVGHASVARDGDGDFIVTWSQNDGTAADPDWNVYYQRFNALGGEVDSEPVLVNTETEGAQRYSSVAVDTEGDFIIVWQSEGQDGSGYGVYAQRFSRSAEPVGGANEIQLVQILGDITTATFTLNFDGQITAPITYNGNLVETASQIEQAFANLASPVLVKVEVLNDTDLAVEFIGEHARRDVAPLVLNNASIAGSGQIKLSTDLQGISAELRVNDTTAGNQLFPSVAMDRDGEFVVTWTSFGQDGDAAYESNIYAKTFTYIDSQDFSNSYFDNRSDDTNSIVAQPRILTSGDDPSTLIVPSGSGYDGVVLVETDSAMGTGSLLVGGNYILTAAHVVTDDSGNPEAISAISVTFAMSTGPVTIEAAGLFVHPLYNGDIGDGNDVALILLAQSPPAEAERYDIYRGSDEIGQTFHHLGYGVTGTGQSGEDMNSPTDILREGHNTYDAIGTDIPGLAAGILVYDFDDGTSTHDALGQNFDLNHTGLGDDETNSGVGDSGGPCFINGLIAGITSGGLPNFSVNTDANSTELDSSFGEVSIDVRISSYASWIDSIVGGGNNGSDSGTGNAQLFASSEFLVNNTIDGDQKWSDVAIDADGDFVITWTSYGQDNGGNGPGAGYLGENGIMAQRFNADGTAVADEFQVNSFTQHNQQHSQVAMDADGDFTITWESFQDRPSSSGADSAGSYGVYAQRYIRTELLGGPLYGANGEIGDEIHVNGTIAGDQRFPSIMVDDTGDAIIAWTGNGPGDPSGVFLQRYYQMADDAGPIVTDVHYLNAPEGGTATLETVLDDVVIVNEVAQFVVTFGEDMNVDYGSQGAHSVLNPELWQLVRNGVVMNDAIVSIEFGLNQAYNSLLAAAPSGKYEAVITFDADAEAFNLQSLTNGDYVLTVTDGVWDIFDNPLDGDRDGHTGGDYQVAFTVLASGIETRVNTDPDGNQVFLDDASLNGAPNSPQSVADDADGDYGVVWIEEGRMTDEVQTITFGGAWGMFGLSYNGSASGDIVYVGDGAATAASIQTQLDALGLDTLVTALDDTTIEIVFTGTDANADHPQLVVEPGSANDISGDVDVETDREGGVSIVGVFVKLYDVEWYGSTDTERQSTLQVREPINPATDSVWLNNEICVTDNPTATYASIAMDADGDFIITWSQDDNPSGAADWNVYARRYDAMGNPLGDEFLVNTVTKDEQRFSTVAIDHDGEFVIAWQSEGQDGNGYEIYAQAYDRFGNALGKIDELQVVTMPSNSTGTFKLVYKDAAGVEHSTGDIAHNGDLVTTAQSIQTELAALGLQTEVLARGENDIDIRFVGADGGQDHRDLLIDPGTMTGLKVQTQQDGKKGEFRVNQNTEGDQVFASAAMDALGNFVVTWTSYDNTPNDGDPSDIYARQFVWVDNENRGDVEDEFVGGNEFRVNQTTDGEQRWSDVAMDMRGDYVITWTSVAEIANTDEKVGIDGTQDVFAQRYVFITLGGVAPIDNVAVSGEFRVNTVTQGTQQHSSVAMDAAGNFVIVWESFQDLPRPSGGQPNSLGIYAQAYVSNGQLGTVGGNGALDDEYAVNGTKAGPQRMPGVALDDAGDVVIVWSGNGEVLGQEDNQGIFMRRQDLDEDTAGPTVTDVLYLEEIEGETPTLEVVLYDGLVSSDVNQLVVTFGENLNTLYGDNGAHSISNPDHWELRKNGILLQDGIVSIAFGLNQAWILGMADAPSGKYEAVLTFDVDATKVGNQALNNGAYTLTLDDTVQDLFGNPFDGNLDGTPGLDFQYVFSIRSQQGGDDPVSGGDLVSNGRTDLETPGAVAVDADGDYVATWTTFSGRYLQVPALNGTTKRIADGETFTIEDAAGTTVTFEFDKNGQWTPGNVVLSYLDNGPSGYDSGAVVAEAIVDAINEAVLSGSLVGVVAAADGLSVRLDGVADLAQSANATVGATAGRDRVWFQIYDAEGVAKLAQPQEVTPLGQGKGFEFDKQGYANVAIDADGDFIVSWTNYRDSDGNGSTDAFNPSDVYARRYRANGTPYADAFLVNTFTQDNQKWSSVAMDVDGDFVIAWSSRGQENRGQAGFAYGIYAQRYDRFGRAVGSEFQVNTTMAGNQQFPNVAMGADGRFVIVWQSDQNAVGDDIIARLYNADGSPAISPLVGEFLVNDTVIGNQRYPDVDMDLSGGRFVVTWSSSQETDDATGYGVYAKTFDWITTASETIEFSYAEHGAGDVIDFGEGANFFVDIPVNQNFVIEDVNVQLWINHEDPSDLFVSLVSPDGTEIVLFQEVPREGDAPGSTMSGPNGQDFNGTILDDEPAVGAQVTISIIDPETAQPQFVGTYTPQGTLSAFDGQTSMGTQGTGVWRLHVWDNDPDDDPDQEAIYDTAGNLTYAHTLDGGRVWDWSIEFTRSPASSLETLVNTTTAGNQLYSSVTMDAQGDFIVAWCGYGDEPGQEDSSQYGVFTQRFDGTFARQGGETRMNVMTEGVQWLPSISGDADGNYVVVWTGAGVTAGTTNVFQYNSSKYVQEADLEGPIVTDVFTVDSSGATPEYTPLFDGGVGETGMTQLVVAFSEELSTAQSTVGGQHTPAIGSVLNSGNWILERGGTEVLGGISNISFRLNPETGRYEALLALDGNGMGNGAPGLEPGDYVLSVRDLLVDVEGNRLDGDYDGFPGTDPAVTGYTGYHISFSVPESADMLGPEHRVNPEETVDYVQTVSKPEGTGYARETTNVSIGVDDDGDYVVVWTSYGQDDANDSNGAGVYARRFDRNDQPLGGEFRVNNLTVGDQKNASVAMDADGDFVVVWEAQGVDGSWDVYAQRFDAAGNRLDNDRDSRIATDPFRSQPGSEDIEILVNTTRTGEQFNASIDCDRFGNFVVVWGSAGAGFGYYSNVYLQAFDYVGRPVGGQVQVNQPDTIGFDYGGWSTGFKVNPDVAMDPDGDIVVAWDEVVQVENGVAVDTVILCRMFNRDGTPRANFVASTDAMGASMVAFGGTDIGRMARNPSVDMNAAGDFIIAYETYDIDFTDGPLSYNIHYSRFRADGFALQLEWGDEFWAVNTVTWADPFNNYEIDHYFSGSQVNPSVAMADDGSFVITWDGNGAEHDALDPEGFDTVANPDSAGVWAKWFYAADDFFAPDVASGQMRVNVTEAGVQQFGSVVMTPSGDAIVAWMGAGVGDQHGVFTRSYRAGNDTSGPLATELRYESSPGVYDFVADGDNIYGNPQTLLVVFDEELNTERTGAGGLPGLHSVENVNNWILVNGRGEELHGAIRDVQFRFDGALQKWVAAVTFAGPGGVPASLVNGTYSLVALAPIQDKAGNGLSLTGYRPNGTGRLFDLDGTAPTIDPLAGFGFQFTINNTWPGSPTENSVDQLVTTVPPTIFGEDDLGLTGYQDDSDVARNTNGDYVVVWVEYGEVISTLGMTVPEDIELPIITPTLTPEANIMAQRFDASGRARGAAILVNTLITGDQIDPAVAIDNNGNFVVVWSGEAAGLGDDVDDGSIGPRPADIYAQRFDADGNILGGQFRVNQWTNSVQDEPSIAMSRTTGDYVITWSSFAQDGNMDGVYGRFFRANGLAYGNEFLVNVKTTAAQGDSEVALATNANGTYTVAVTWVCEGEASGTGIRARVFNFNPSTGTRTNVTGDILVNTYTNYNQLDPAIAMDADGDFAITWTSRQDGSGWGIYAQRFNAAGVKQGAEFLVNETTVHDQLRPDISMAANGDFVIVWDSYNQDTIPPEDFVRSLGVFARAFAANGSDFNHPAAGVVGEYRVNAQTDGDQYAPAVSMDSFGHYVVTWTGYNTELTTYVENPEGDAEEEFLETPLTLTAIYSRFVDPPAEDAGDADLADVVISGTSGNDVFEFLGGVSPELWIVRLNGVRQTIPSNVATLRFDGKAGTDAVILSGASADDVVEFWTGRAAMTSYDYSVVVENVETITASGGGGEDMAVLHDSLGADTFVGKPDVSEMTGEGFTHRAENFETVQAYADSTGSDTAFLYDSAGDDTFTAAPASSKMTGGEYLIQADGFEYVKAYATGTGNDVANLYDSALNDTLIATDTYAKIYNAGGYYVLATGFGTVRAYATAGGKDVANLYGSDGDDTFTASSTYAKFRGDGFHNVANYFESVNASGMNGNDTATLYDSTGDDTFVAGPRFGQMYGAGYQIRADFFRWVYGFGNAGGNDLASLYDSAGNDTLYVTQNYAQLYGDAYFNRAYGFDRVDARATGGGYDEATMHDSALSDYLEAEGDWVRLSNEQIGFAYWAAAFDRVTAQSTSEGDTKRIAQEIDFVLAMEGIWTDE